MLNIAIDDANNFYRYGLECFLEDLFANENNKGVHFEALTKFNINKADVVVQSYVAGEEYACHSKLKYRNKPGLIIGLYDQGRGDFIADLPTCIKNVIFIYRTDSVSDCREKIISAWDEIPLLSGVKDYKKCFHCKYLTLTPQQIVIARKMLQGQDLSQIAISLGINVKTVSAHKRLIMHKFNLHTDFELLRFFNSLRSHTSPINLFS
jgi:DNA-binding CsgD family transcriptional regulator